MRKIHPTAIISSQAELDDEVEVGPFSVIEGPVKIGRGTKVGSHVHLLGYTTIGQYCRLFTGAVIGSIPQDLKYRGEETYLVVGDYNIIREYVTMNPGTAKGESTIVGSHNLFMANVHIAHNCVIGNQVIIANFGALAGHVVVEDYAIIGGLTGVHQFCRIGAHSITGGCSKITKDILPFVMADGHPAVPWGINKIGLKRRNFSPEKIDLLEKAYRILFRSGLNVSAAVEALGKFSESEEIRQIITFIRNSQRGIAREGLKETDV
ncbi:MAG: acyl-ACP--UDP-N-acetylglucosamine O-acyltransferase [Candidatus Omnitrophica bacterium]|nr:acyl-ACP--UDP-N-acetylglucosamine O-acyltransferase [Candidatus Omnitrophota bacterium]